MLGNQECKGATVATTVLRSVAVLCAVMLVLGGATPAGAQSEPLRVRRNFIGMHNLKDGGPEVREGMDWTKTLSGDTGYVFDWVFDYSPTAEVHWVGEAIQRNLVPCVRVQECNGGCTPNPGYAGQVASQICTWKLAHPEYADRLVYLQLWNEPGDPRDYVPMDVYADYLVQAHQAVHSAEAAAAASNPDIAGTLKTMTPGQNNPDSWEIGFAHNPQAAFSFDVWGTHPYPESYPPWYNMHEGHGFVTKHKMIDGYLRDLDKCAEYGRRGVRVMITETAYGDHLGISYEGYPKTTWAMAADYNVEAFGTWWYQWPELIAVHPYILANWSWDHFAWVDKTSGSKDNDPADGVREPTAPRPQYTQVRQWRMDAVAAGLLAPARLSPYRGAVGSIRGTVTRSDTNDAVKHANVYTDGYEFGGPTLYDGQYVVLDVPVGTYTLTVEKRGYLPASQQITVTAGQETVTDFSLVYTGKVPKGFYFIDCGAPGLDCAGSCDGCSLYADFGGQTFRTPSDVGFIKYAAAKPNVGGLTLRFTIIEGDNPNGTVVGSFDSYYLEPELGGEMIGGEAPGDGIPVQPNTTYFLKVQRTDGQGVYLYTSDSNPYPDGIRWVGNTPQPGWDMYAAIRGNTVEVVTATGSIAGIVRDNVGQPIAGVAVSTSPGGHSAMTDPYGQYIIDTVPANVYNVSASKIGYSTEIETGVTVQPDATVTVDFVLDPGPTTGTITGWVKDSAANPLTGALVETNPGGYTTVTGSGGSYTLADVVPGTYAVVASKSGYHTNQVTGVVVTAGQIATANITLTPEAPFEGLCNGDFEGGAHDDPDADHRTGTCWNRFSQSGVSKCNVTWLGSGAHSADYVQDIYEGDWTAGVYQNVENTTVGGTYTGSAWVRGAEITFWIGIDPFGGISATSANVQWSSPAAPGDSWAQISRQVTAQSSSITLFIKAGNPSLANHNAFIDDAVLTEDSLPPEDSILSLWPTALTPTVEEGNDADPDTINIANTGGGTLNYTISDDADWLSVVPDAGTSTGETDVLTVYYATSSMSAGIYLATITATEDNSSAQFETVEVTLTVTGDVPTIVPADFDHDGDVDQRDFGHFQACLTGVGIVQDDPACLDARLDIDADVDQEDFAIFQGCLSGANIPPDPDCSAF